MDHNPSKTHPLVPTCSLIVSDQLIGINKVKTNTRPTHKKSQIWMARSENLIKLQNPAQNHLSSWCELCTGSTSAWRLRPAIFEITFCIKNLSIYFCLTYLQVPTIELTPLYCIFLRTSRKNCCTLLGW